MSSAAEFLPASRSLKALEEAAQAVGELPRDKESEPFVGPAGRLLDRALEESVIDRVEVYLTNAVKHFKWKPKGKRRLHQTPRAGEAELAGFVADLEGVASALQGTAR
jgi:uracil-DNA glycosylase